MSWWRYHAPWLITLGFFWIGLGLGWLVDTLIPGSDPALAWLYLVGLVVTAAGLGLQVERGSRE